MTQNLGAQARPSRAARVITMALFAATAAGFQASARAGVFMADDVIMIQGSPDVIHFHKSKDHVPYSWLVGLEWQRSDRWLGGYSRFENSFGQPSHYLYGGYTWPLQSWHPNVYVKLTGGLVLGYKEPYENKIPFNNNGVAPGIIPGLGYKEGRFNVQMNLLGRAGLMFTFGYDLFR